VSYAPYQEPDMIFDKKAQQKIFDKKAESKIFDKKGS